MKLLSVCATLGAIVRVMAAGEDGTAQALLGSHFGRAGVEAAFDYVVVGGGTAGLTVATRLAEAGRSVAVVEAGGFYELDNPNRSAIPADAFFYLGWAPIVTNPKIDWGLQTLPQPGLGGRPLAYAQGKTLGGSSARNTMVYQRGTKASYQRWADTVKDASYTFDRLLPYFQKSVRFTPPNDTTRAANATPSYNPAAYRRSGAPLQVSYPNEATSIASYLRLALPEIGVRATTDFVSGSLLGSQYVANTIDPGTETRSSSEASFLRSALRENVPLTVYPFTLAKRVLFDHHKKATGVVVNTNGTTYVLSAKREVILSAGAFRSPQMLMVSGIGPKATLQKHGIPVLASRPGVGQNMWDHLSFHVTHRVNLVTHSSLAIPAFAAAAAEEYQHLRGLLTNSGGDFLGWEKLPAASRAQMAPATLAGLASFPDDWPEIEFISLAAFAGYGRDLGAEAPQDGNFYTTTAAALIAPFSRGNVTICSRDTADNPVVSPNFLLDRRDEDVALQAFKRLRQMWETPTMRRISIGGEVFPGINNVTTDAQILQFIRDSAIMVWHAAELAVIVLLDEVLDQPTEAEALIPSPIAGAMGQPQDEMAVVDSEARVIGVKGLRVVDASAFPFLPPGHPQATIYALAEKIAHIIITKETS
ncbi:MAG: hypothetical protein M1826_007647 [Phylliscum demangeonii]|nr:MAG: hypothetical protein M1826_007647 [Phylliscum demangeonii]